MKKIPTPHITSKKEEVARTVIMPGDPLRAKFIAQNYLENVIEVNSVRNMLAYTGDYKGQTFTVMGSGMGMPSIGIYAYELFEFYDVENIIRIGSAGAFSEDLSVYDVVMATASHTQSNFASVAFEINDTTLFPSEKLNQKLRESALECKVDLYEGKIETSDSFYKTTGITSQKIMEEEGCIAREMECFGLFATADVCNKNAACILTIAGHMKKQGSASVEDREKSFTNMIEIVLNAKY